MKKLLVIVALIYTVNFSTAFAGQPYRLSIRQRNSRGQAYEYSNSDRYYPSSAYGSSSNQTSRNFRRNDYSTRQDFGDDHYVFDSRGNIVKRYRHVGSALYVFNRAGNITKIIQLDPSHKKFNHNDFKYNH